MPSEVYYDDGLLYFSVWGSEGVFVSLTVDAVFKLTPFNVYFIDGAKNWSTIKKETM